MRSSRTARDAFNKTTSPAFKKLFHRLHRRFHVRKFNHAVQSRVARRRAP